jgi:hypothetical protein
MDDDGGFVVGLFNNLKAAKECHVYHSDVFPGTRLIHINTECVDSEFIEPNLDD